MSNFIETLKCPYRSPHVVVEAIRDIIKDKVVCELGCGYGDLFPSFMKYTKEVKGFEFNKERVAVCKEKGLNVIQGDWFQDSIPEADVYYFWPNDPNDNEFLINLLMAKEDFEGTIIAAADASLKEGNEVATLQRLNHEWGGEIRSFCFNEGDDYRENGEFVLTIIKKEKKETKHDFEEKKKPKNLVIILSHCDSVPKVKVLKETIASLRSIDVDILLTSHVPVDLDVQDMVDYYIFDKSNPIIDLKDKALVRWGKQYVKNLDCFVKFEIPMPDHWGGVMNQIIKAADIGLNLDYDCYSFIGYDVTLEEVHLKELSNPCPTEDIVTCDWGDSWIETKKVKKYSNPYYDKEDEIEDTFRNQYASCDFNIIKKGCFKKIRNLLSIEKYLERHSNGKRFFDVAEEYWTSLVHLFKPRFVKRIEEKIQLTELNQNYLNDLFKLMISEGEDRNVLLYEIKEPVKFRINNEKIIEVKDNHLETDVRQIQYLTKDGPYVFSKELEESDRKSHLITVLDD